MTAGARQGSVMDTSLTGGGKTVPTEALQLEYTRGGGLSETLFPSNEAVDVMAHSAGAGLFQTIQKYELEANDDVSTCCGKRQACVSLQTKKPTLALYQLLHAA